MTIKNKPFIYLPPEMGAALGNAMNNHMISEIRLYPAEGIIAFSDKPYFITAQGALSECESDKLILSRQEFYKTFERMCQNSVYAMQKSLREGYITLPGGHRAGVSGRAVINNGEIVGMQEISAVNIRIARQILTAADSVIDLIAPMGKIKNTLIISPPGCGKTTILREMARLLGGGKYRFRVGIMDERCEIAAMHEGVAQMDVGYLSFVYSDCPKHMAMLMALRSMSPDVIITDEIGGEKDENAIFSLINGGVKIICSCHGYGREDVLRRGLTGALIENNIFERIIVLSRRHGAGYVEEVY